MEQEQNPYLVEVLRGARSIGYYAVFCLLALGPLIAESIVYRCKLDAEIQVILMLLISVFLCLSTEILGRHNKGKMEAISKEKDNVSGLLQDISTGI